MASKETDQLLEDELQALHQSIEQLNSGNNEGEAINNRESNKRMNSKRKRTTNQPDVETQTPSKKTKKRPIRIPEEIEADCDGENPIDDILEEIAQRKNLTTNNVKHLLRNIIANESVQEMLKCSLDSTLKMSFEPKLTRSKTKEWLETQNIAWPPSGSKIKTSDTHILMDGDFPEDSSDDEYRPCEEDQSDEESFISSHTSDVGSPASSAPPTPSVLNDDNFKRPFPIEPVQDDLIGSRTRSKLPLNDTPLEHLELAFIPPDISTDMYDSDCDNEEWRLFLKEFVCPTSHHSAENGDDEEADPEYNVLEEEEEVDDEELRADRTVQITKKEVSELLSELFEHDLVSSSDEETSDQQAVTKKTGQDILQTAMSDIIVQLDSPSESSRSGQKPTGIVQPLVPSPVIESNGVAFTVSFPTIDCQPIEIFPQYPQSPCPTNQPSSESGIELSAEARMLLTEQMRKHVQLLTQMHLITAQQSSLTSVTDECRIMLHELLPCSQKVEIANLEEAIQLIKFWDHTVVKRTPEELSKYQRTIVNCGDRKKYFKRSSKHPDRFPFDPQMIELMAESRVFIYPELLPKLAIFQSEPGPCNASTHEEQLVAMGLEQFTPFCSDLLSGSRAAVDSLVYSMISHYMLPHRTPKKIGQHVKRLLLQKSPPNPVKYYMEHKVAPPVEHDLQPFDPLSVQRLCDVPSSVLPKRWREMMLIHVGAHHRDRKKPYLMTSRSEFHPNPASITWNPPVPLMTVQQTATQHHAFGYISPSEPKKKMLAICDKPDSRTSQSNAVTSCDQPVQSINPQFSYVLLLPNTPHPNMMGSMINKKNPRGTTKVKKTRRKKASSKCTLTNDEQVADESEESTKNKQCQKPEKKSECDPTVENDQNAIERDSILCDEVVSGSKESKNENQSQLSLADEPNEIAKYPEKEEDKNVQYPNDPLEHSEPNRETSTQDAIASSETPSTPSDVSDIQIDPEHVEMDFNSDPDLPLDASSPHQTTANTSSNQGAKRYVLLQRPDNPNQTQDVHVWGPTFSGGSAPLRQVADHQSSQSSNDRKNPSSQENCESGSGGVDGNPIYNSSAESGAGAGSSGGDDGDKPPSSPTPTGNHASVDDNVMMEDDDDEDDNVSFDLLPLANTLHSAPSKGRSPAHRQIRHQRNARRILDSWMADDDPSQSRSDAYAQVYFMKVRDRLEHDPLAFKEFVTTLGHFQSTSCSTLDLYKKIESTLKDHPDLMEEFVLFLSPEAATQCGVQFQYFLYVRMREFFFKLKIHFKDSPSQLKRTLKSLQQVESSPSPSINDIKNAILPLLKGNAHLTQSFLQLFPDDAPPPSEAGDFEDINLDQVHSGDEFEQVHLKETTATAMAPSKENELKGTSKRINTASKSSAKNKSKGKSWKKPPPQQQ